MSLDIKEVIQIARAQFKELLPELSINTKDTAPPKRKRVAAALSGLKQDPADIRLEEIEKDGDNWAVTFSVPNPNYSPQALLDGIRSARTTARIAKVIVVDGTEGKLIALRERAA